jgi:hypothetical protein
MAILVKLGEEGGWSAFAKQYAPHALLFEDIGVLVLFACSRADEVLKHIQTI